MKNEIPKCITTVFDPNDEFETSLAKHVVSKGNRSRYIKRLIYNDMIGAREQISTTVHEDLEEENNEMAGFF